MVKVEAERSSSPFDRQKINRTSQKGQQWAQAPTAVEQWRQVGRLAGTRVQCSPPPLPLLKPSCSPLLKSQCTPVKLGHSSETSGTRLTSNMLALGTTSGFRGAFTLWPWEGAYLSSEPLFSHLSLGKH